MCPQTISHFWLFAVPLAVAHQIPLSMGFSRQEYWSGLPFHPPGNLPDPGIKPASLMSPALGGGFFTTSTTWEAQIITQIIQHNLFNPHSVTPAKSFLSQKVTLTSSGHQNMDTFWGGNHHSAYLSFYCTANGQWLTASYNKPCSMWSETEGLEGSQLVWEERKAWSPCSSQNLPKEALSP